MEGQFFNDEQKKFKHNLMVELLATFENRLMLFSQNNSYQHTLDLFGSIIIMFTRDIFTEFSKKGGISDIDFVIKKWKEVSGIIEKGIIKNLLEEKDTHH